MTTYQRLELEGRLKIALLQAVEAVQLQDWELYDKYISHANRLRCEIGDELDSTG